MLLTNAQIRSAPDELVSSRRIANIRNGLIVFLPSIVIAGIAESGVFLEENSQQNANVAIPTFTPPTKKLLIADFTGLLLAMVFLVQGLRLKQEASKRKQSRIDPSKNTGPVLNPG